MGTRLLTYGAEAQNRTGDTRIFSPLLYRLSYLGAESIVAIDSVSVKQLHPVWYTELLCGAGYLVLAPMSSFLV